MKKQLFLFAFIAHGLLIQAQSAIFNGKNLEGWQIHGTEKWYVQDGELICESGPDAEYGYLSTVEHFKDFELELEFKQEADGNSGVFFRSTVEGTIVSGWQVEVAPPKMHTGGIYESYGRGWLIKPDPENDQYLKMGDWNTLKIIVVGDQVNTYLNGHEMVAINDEKIGQGVGGIALQIHSGGGIKVKWKNINIKPL
ncbi:MAG: 3-keto-disaccharide hydrolase [Flavobacteriaceae bacterium]